MDNAPEIIPNIADTLGISHTPQIFVFEFYGAKGTKYLNIKAVNAKTEIVHTQAKCNSINRILLFPLMKNE